MKIRLLGFELALARVRDSSAAAVDSHPVDPSERLAATRFARDSIRLLHGQSIESFLASLGLESSRFTRVLVTGEGYRPAVGGGSVVQAALEDLAANAIRLGCSWVVDPHSVGFSGFASRATSGFGVLLGGVGFGFSSPDGTFSEGLHLLGTGLVPASSASAAAPSAAGPPTMVLSTGSTPSS